MGFFIFLVSLLIFLIVITVTTTIIKLSLLVTTKYRYETHILIIPGILYTILWVSLFVLWLVLSNHYSQTDILTLAINSIFESTFNIAEFKPFLLCGIVCSVVGIFIQPFVFLTVNIPYQSIRIKLKRLFSKFKKFFVKKVLKKDMPPEGMPIKDVAIKEKWVKLKFLNALISSVFSFAIIMLIVFLLILTSRVISTKILNLTTNAETADEYQKNEQVDI